MASGGEPVTPLPQADKEFLVVVHLIKGSDGLLPADQSVVLADFASLNTIFAPIGISFKVCEFRTIDNYIYNPIKDIHSKEIVNTYSVDQRINVFYSKEVIVSGKTYCGFATLSGIGSVTSQKPAVYIGCTGATTLAHEFGHFFGLSHTFEGNGTELADGSNCATAGDMICDTPADPYSEGADMEEYIKGYIMGNCLFTGDLKDANGNYFDPDVSNLMGYYSACRCLKFSHDQYNSMGNYYLSHRVAW